jgi:hypothetical protein
MWSPGKISLEGFCGQGIYLGLFFFDGLCSDRTRLEIPERPKKFIYSHIVKIERTLRAKIGENCILRRDVYLQLIL